MAGLNSKTTAVKANISSGFFVYAINAANSADYKVSGSVFLEGSLPDYTSNNGKYLTLTAGALAWATVDALPSQTGNSGKFLTTNGTAASWATVSGGGDLIKVGSTTLGSSAATISLSGLDLNTDKHWIVRAQLLGTVANNTPQFLVNGATATTNYAMSYITQSTGTVSALDFSAQRSFVTFVDTTQFTSLEIEIHKPSSSAFTTISYRTQAVSMSNGRVTVGTLKYTVNTNITSFGFDLDGNNFATGSWLAIYKLTR